jgi:hypothetical protein
VLFNQVPLRTSNGGKTWFRDSVKNSSYQDFSTFFNIERRGNSPIYLMQQNLKYLIRDFGTSLTKVLLENEFKYIEIKYLSKDELIKISFLNKNFIQPKIQIKDVKGSLINCSINVVGNNTYDINAINLINGVYLI